MTSNERTITSTFQVQSDILFQSAIKVQCAIFGAQYSLILKFSCRKSVQLMKTALLVKCAF